MRYFLYIVAFFFSCYNTIAQSDSSKLFIVGNKTGLSKMTIATVKSILRGEEALWKNKESITVVLPAASVDGAEIIARKIFDASVMGMKRYWLGLVFQGRANPPSFLNSSEEMIQYISKNSGAFGVVICKKEDIPPHLIIELDD